MNSATLGSGHPLAIKTVVVVAGATALICAAVLLLAFAGVAVRGFRRAGTGGLVSAVENNWLVLLYKLHVRVEGFSSSMLHSQNAIDYVIMGLTCATSVGLYLTLKEASRAWSIVALALPFAGVVIFLVTQLAGRSALMGAVLAFSIIMIWSHGFGMAAAALGIAAGTLLLVGDLTEGLVHSTAIGALVAVGYFLLIGWFGFVGTRMLAFT